jgi:tripartite-type tricarboxylate transporter receptor subunit TctC
MPAGTPDEITSKVADWIEEGLKNPEAKEFFYRGGFQPWVGVRGAKLKEFAEKEYTKWGTIIKLTNIEPQ